MAEQDTEATSRETQREFRRVLAQALSDVRSAESRSSYAAVTLVELVDEQIDVLAESTDPWQVPRLTRVKNLRRELTDAIAKIKDTDPAVFREPEPSTDANTPVEGT